MINKTLVKLNRLIDPEPKVLNILTMPTHEGFQTILSHTGHNFYMLSGPNIKRWDYHTRPLPPNHYLYNAELGQIRGDVRFDLVLCQNRIAQWDILAGIAAQLDLPLVVLDHTEPPPNIQPEQLQALSTRVGDANVFITEHNRESWANLNGVVINHGIDTKIFNGYTGDNANGVSVVNYFRERDVFCGWSLWQEITKNVKVDLIGENPGLSVSINKIEDLVSTLADHRYYLNTSQHSPIPLSLMEAMSIGLPIVTTAKQEIPKIIKHGVNGLMSNDPAELVEFCKQLENDKDYAFQLGQVARQTIIDNFSIEKFVDNWNRVFYSVIKVKL